MAKHAEGNLNIKVDFSTLINDLDATICYRDIEGALVVWNNAFAESIRVAFGREPYVGMKTVDYLSPEQRENLKHQRDLFQQVLKGKKRSSEFSYNLPTGKTEFFEITWTPSFHEEKVTGVIEFIQNVTKRKGSEIMLQQTEMKFRSVIENANETIIVTQDEKIQFSNPQALKLTGYSEEELSLISVFDLISPEDRHRAMQNYKVRISDKIVSDRYSIRIETKTGEIKWVDVSATQIQLQGRPASLAMLLDITEQKRVEEKLKISEKKFYKVFQASHDAITISTVPDSMFVDVNESFERIFGYCRDEVIGRTSLEINLWKDPGLREKIFPAYLRDGYMQNIRGEFIAKSGETGFCNMNFRLMDIDGVKYSIGIISDITESLRAKEVLQLNTSRLQEAQQIAHIGSWDWNIVTNHLFWSDEIFRIFGLQPEEFDATYEAFLNAVHPEDRESVEGSVDEALREKKSYDIQHRIVLPNGDERIVHERARVSFCNQGKPLRMFGTVQDITEAQKTFNTLRKNEKALLESQADLRTLAGRLLSVQEEERRRLARELHDDLAQRLAMLAIDAGKLKMEADCTGEAAGALTSIQDDLIKISEDVHNISRQLHPSIIEDLGLEAALQSEINNFSSREGISVNFESDLGAMNLPMEVSICFFRIFQEALRNVMKHAEAKIVIVQLALQDEILSLKIIDDGRGFEPEEVRQLPGLGLKSMRERIRLVTGSINFNSQPGQGSEIVAKVNIKLNKGFNNSVSLEDK